jgi:hypothetical protein
MFKFKFLFLVFLLLLIHCSKEIFQTYSKDINNDSKVDQVMHTHKGLDSAILIETDTDLDGKIDDYLWVNGKAEEKESSMLLYNEGIVDGKVVRKTWYGPGNLKLIEMTDEDGDGYMEATTYFNALAKPKVLVGISARIEIDLMKNGQTALWIYPGLKIELDKNKDGTPDCSLDWKKVTADMLGGNNKWQRMDAVTCQPISSQQSIVMHPELILQPTNKAVIVNSIGKN